MTMSGGAVFGHGLASPLITAPTFGASPLNTSGPNLSETRPMTPIPKCGQRGCPNPHPARPWVERQRAVSVPVVAGVPTGAIGNTLTATPTWQPEWLRRLTAKDMTGASS